MCMIDDADGDWHAETQRTTVASAGVRCHECGRELPIGEPIDWVQGHNVHRLDPPVELPAGSALEPAGWDYRPPSLRDIAEWAWADWANDRWGEIQAERIGGRLDDDSFDVLVPDGKPFAICSQCIAARRWLTVVCNGWLYGGVHEDLEQHMDEDYACGALNALCRHMSNQWTHRKTRAVVPVANVERLVARALAHAEAIGGTP